MHDTPRSPRQRPRVSVLMAVYNGESLIRQSVDSILGQTFGDFEFIIVDDASTDRTPEILGGYRDARLRVLRNPRNLGVVETRNRGFSVAQGEFIAILDHDDLSRPTRLARQVEFLDRHPEVALVSTAGTVLEAGRLRPFSPDRALSPAMLRWMLHFRNPIIFSSVMVRTEVVQHIGTLLRRERELAEDYDLYFNALKFGEVAQIDESLAIYRVHGGNISRRRREVMIVKTGEVLAEAYRHWFGPEAEEVGQEVARYVAAGDPIGDRDTLDRLGANLERIAESFIVEFRPEGEELARMRAYLGRLWWQVARNAMRSGQPRLLGGYKSRPALTQSIRVPFADQLGAVAAGSIPGRKNLRNLLRGGARNDAPPPRMHAEAIELGALEKDLPPTLYMVVDTASRPGVSAVPHEADLLARTQAVFGRYNLRPVWLVDEHVAASPQALAPLADALRRGDAYLGIESPGGEEAPEIRLRRLRDRVAAKLGIAPLFCRVAADDACRIDIDALRTLNLRACVGGTAEAPRLACNGGDSFLFLPVTSGRAGLTRRRVALATGAATAARQVALLRGLLRAGRRLFVANHSCPVPPDQGAELLLDQMEALCGFFFEQVGGMPGDPLVLFPPQERFRLADPAVPAADLAPAGCAV